MEVVLVRGLYVLAIGSFLGSFFFALQPRGPVGLDLSRHQEATVRSAMLSRAVRLPARDLKGRATPRHEWEGEVVNWCSSCSYGIPRLRPRPLKSPPLVLIFTSREALHYLGKACSVQCFFVLDEEGGVLPQFTRTLPPFTFRVASNQRISSVAQGSFFLKEQGRDGS
jgi:hypothetical protein